MAYEFKKLSDVEVVETPIDTANVLIEEDGVIKKVAKGEVGGVKVASTAEVGQTIVVKAVDENGNPTEWECADVVKSWHDLEDKPFGEEEVRTQVQREITVTLDSNGYGSYEAEDWLWGNKTYIFKWDGVEYETTTYDNSDADTIAGFVINDEPLTFTNTTNITGTASMAGNHTLEIFLVERTLTQLEEKFVEDAVYPKLGPFVGYCHTSAGSGSKTATSGAVSYPLKELFSGVMVNVFFSTANTASDLKLNVHGTGYYPIYIDNTTVAPPEALTTGFHSFVYTNEKWFLIT